MSCPSKRPGERRLWPAADIKPQQSEHATGDTLGGLTGHAMLARGHLSQPAGVVRAAIDEGKRSAPPSHVAASGWAAGLCIDPASPAPWVAAATVTLYIKLAAIATSARSPHHPACSRRARKSSRSWPQKISPSTT